MHVCLGQVCAWLFAKSLLEAPYYLMSLYLEFHNEPSFRCRDTFQNKIQDLPANPQSDDIVYEQANALAIKVYFASHNKTL